MLFNSLQFLIFFPIVAVLFFSIPQRYRWVFLLGASYYFYACWKPEYLLLIILSTIIDYYAGIHMGRTADKSKRKKFLILSLAANLGLLFAFKYFNFFNGSMRSLYSQFNILYNVPNLKILLPIGISFYTFQTLSYSIDVYRGNKKPEKHLGIFALYVAFFPQLVAGPIERSTHLLPQFFEKKVFDYGRVTDGLRLMLWGFFKKLVIADRLAIYVNAVYNNPDRHNGLSLLVATYFFAFQIYCDFSGYSDIAIGSAKVLGFDLMDNFRRPYWSKSIDEFWKRWHISLSSWFRDYLYIPLGGSRVKRSRWYFNLLAVFMISGLWHGASWTFVVWGALHGFYLIFGIFTKNIRKKLSDLSGIERFPRIAKLVKILFTFHLVLFAWIFFRANSLKDALLIIKKIFFLDMGKLYIGNRQLFLYAGMGIALLVLFEFLAKDHNFHSFVSDQHIIYRWSLYIFFVLIIILTGVFSKSEFIYFQF